jgi:Putative zincin peptidase
LERGEKVKSNDLGYYQNKYKIIVKFNDSEPKIRLAGCLTGFLIGLIMMIPFFVFVSYKISTLLVNDIHSTFVLFFLFPAYFVVTFLHELIHSIFLYFFSKQKPRIRFNYSLLRANVSVSRKEGIISYLSPFVVITILFAAISFFVNPITQILLIALVIENAAASCNDFLFSFRLFRCKGPGIRLAHEKTKKGIDTIFFQV